MDYVTLSFIVLIVQCNAGESMIEASRAFLTSFTNGQVEQAVYYTVMMNESLDLRFQNTLIADWWCDDFFNVNNSEIISSRTIFTKSVVHINNITHGMSTLWKCTLRERNKNNLISSIIPKYYFLYINLHVKGAKSVLVTVNGKVLTFIEADLSKPYDGETIYFYKDGEHVEIVCRNTQSTGTVHLGHHNIKNATNVSDPGALCIQIHSESNNSYIDCVYNTTEPSDKYVYRVTFVVQKQMYPKNPKLINGHLSDNRELILGISTGAVLVILGVTGIAWWYVRTKNARGHIESPYGDLKKESDTQTPQHTIRCEYRHEEYDYSQNQSKSETQYEIPESVYDIDSEDHYYTKIDYTRCQTKTVGTQIRNSKVYDEPYTCKRQVWLDE